MSKAKRISIRMPTSLRKDIGYFAKRDRNTISAQTSLLINDYFQSIDDLKGEILGEQDSTFNTPPDDLGISVDITKRIDEIAEKSTLINENALAIVNQLATKVPEKVIEMLHNQYKDHLIEIFAGFALQEEERNKDK